MTREAARRAAMDAIGAHDRRLYEVRAARRGPICELYVIRHATRRNPRQVATIGRGDSWEHAVRQARSGMWEER